MKRHLLLSAVLAMLLAAFLGACGGDDNKDNNNAQTPISIGPGPTAPADTGATGTTGKQTKSGSKKKSEKAEKKSEKLRYEDPNSPEAQAKVSYAVAKRVCKEHKLKDLKRIYKPNGTSAKAVAKAVSRGYSPKHRADAAYDGCLAGYKQR